MEAAAEDQRAGLQEEQAEGCKRGTGRVGGEGREERERDHGVRAVSPGQEAGRRIPQHDEKPGTDEQERDLRTGDRGRHTRCDGDHPEPDLGAISEARQLDRGYRDDRHHAGRDPVEECLHHLEPVEVHVQDGHGEHEEKARKDERGRRAERPERPRLQVSDPHHDLGREWPRHGLPERDAVQEVPLGHPRSRRHQIALHVPHRCDGAAEPPRPEAQEVAKRIAEGMLRGGRMGGLGTWSLAHAWVPPSSMIERSSFVDVLSKAMPPGSRPVSSSRSITRVRIMA